MSRQEVEHMQVQLSQDGTVVTLQAAGINPSLVPEPAVTHLQGECEAKIAFEDRFEEPQAKKQRKENQNDADFFTDSSLKHLILTMNKAISLQLDFIENKMEILLNRMCSLEERVDTLLSLSQQNSSVMPASSSQRGAMIVGLPQNGTKAKSESQATTDGMQGLGTQNQVTLITLNTEDDFPLGTWLGDEKNPEMRVRVPITPSDILHVHSNCRTPEKMALTLLDYLFDRETQAASNLSGLGKHGKKQLDPLMIYGVRCHLIHRFGISENDWHRIKQNIDSKCRTAWRRWQRGMPLMVKAFRGKNSNISVHNQMGEELSGSDESSSQDGELRIQQGEMDLRTAVALAEDGVQQREIQILHATPEQISQLQQTHHIQILADDQVIGQLQPGDLALPEGCHVATVTTQSGDILHIQHQQSDAAAVQHQQSGAAVQLQQSDAAVAQHQQSDAAVVQYQQSDAAIAQQQSDAAAVQHQQSDAAVQHQQSDAAAIQEQLSDSAAVQHQQNPLVVEQNSVESRPNDLTLTE